MKDFILMSKDILLIIILAISLTSCKDNNRELDAEEGEDVQLVAGSDEISKEIYRAEISSLNENVNKSRKVSGNVTMEVIGNKLHIMVETSGLEPNMQHLQHLHVLKMAQ